MNKIHVGQSQIIKPLCTTCENIQCDNPIIEKKVSVFGRVGTVKIYQMSENDMYLVKSCPGYMEEYLEDE